MLAASRTAWRMVAATTALGLFSLCCVTSVAATPPPENVRTAILTSVGNGLHLLAPGPYNGPIDQSVIAPYISTNAEAQQAFKDGELSGYVRTWRSKPALHEGLVDIVVDLPAASEGAPFVAGVVHSATTSQPGLRNVPVTSIPDATMYQAIGSTSTTTLEEWYLIFSRGRFASIIVVAAPVGSFTTSYVTQVGERQFARFPIPPPAAAPSDWGPVLVVGCVLVLLAAAVITTITVATSRRRRVRESTQKGTYRYPAVNAAGAAPSAAAYRPIYAQQTSPSAAAPVFPVAPAASSSSVAPVSPPTPRVASSTEVSNTEPDERSAFWDE